LANLGPHWQVDSYSLAIQRTDLPWPRRHHRVTERWVDHRSLDPLFFAWLGLCGQIGQPPAFTSQVAAATPHRELRRALAGADAVWVAHPYPWEWVRRRVRPGTPMVLDAHNIETFLVDTTATGWRGRFATEVERCERVAMGDAALVLSTSDSEAAVALEMGARNVTVVPSGVDVDRVVPVTAAQRTALRASLGLPTTGSLAVFTGSAHPPNVEAVEYIERQSSAYAAAGVSVMIVGRCGVGRSPMPGVIQVGEVRHEQVVPYLQAADIAVCPLVSGSGTSLKSVEFLAAGLPVVSTPVGVRGLDLSDDEAIVC
jgi:glycosyltransferase involved in cell wall biosynthesis